MSGAYVCMKLKGTEPVASSESQELETEQL